MVIACQYFMLVFACDITDDAFRASLGFNFSMLVLAHLIIGFIALILAMFINLLPTLKKLYLKL
jgi:vacuolar-type H+-ATPase subunit I/STV1